MGVEKRRVMMNGEKGYALELSGEGPMMESLRWHGLTLRQEALAATTNHRAQHKREEILLITTQ